MQWESPRGKPPVGRCRRHSAANGERLYTDCIEKPPWLERLFSIREDHVDPPPNGVPSVADVAELVWPRRGVTMRSREASTAHPSTHIRKNHVAGPNHPQEVVEYISRAVLPSLRRPDVATTKLVPECLFMIHSPKSHASSDDVRPSLARRKISALQNRHATRQNSSGGMRA